PLCHPDRLQCSHSQSLDRMLRRQLLTSTTRYTWPLPMQSRSVPRPVSWLQTGGLRRELKTPLQLPIKYNAEFSCTPPGIDLRRGMSTEYAKFLAYPLSD